MPVLRQLQQAIRLRRLAEGRALAALLQVEGHLLRRDVLLIAGSVSQAVRQHQQGYIAAVCGNFHIPRHQAHGPHRQVLPRAVAAAHALPVALQRHAVQAPQLRVPGPGHPGNMRPAVCRRALSVRAKQVRPHQGRRGVLQQRNAEILPGRQPPAVRHRAAHRGAGGGNSLRPARIPRRGLSQVGNGKLADPGPLPAGDLACVKGSLGLGIPLHPGGHILRRRAAVVVAHRRPAAQNRRLHAPGHRGRKGHRFRPDAGAAAVGLAGQRALAAGRIGNLSRQTLRHKPVIARGHAACNGLRRPAEHIAQGMRKATGRSGQANVRRLPYGHAADTGRGGPGYGGQGEASAGGVVVPVAVQPPGEGPHHQGLAAVPVMLHLQGAGAEGAVLVVRNVGVGAPGINLHAAYRHRRHSYGIGVVLLPGAQAAGPGDGGLVRRRVLLLHLPFHPEIGLVFHIRLDGLAHALTLRST